MGAIFALQFFAEVPKVRKDILQVGAFIRLFFASCIHTARSGLWKNTTEDWMGREEEGEEEEEDEGKVESEREPDQKEKTGQKNKRGKKGRAGLSTPTPARRHLNSHEHEDPHLRA